MYDNIALTRKKNYKTNCCVKRGNREGICGILWIIITWSFFWIFPTFPECKLTMIFNLRFALAFICGLSQSKLKIRTVVAPGKFPVAFYFTDACRTLDVSGKCHKSLRKILRRSHEREYRLVAYCSRGRGRLYVRSNLHGLEVNATS